MQGDIMISNGDIQISSSADIALICDSEEIIQSAIVRIQTRLGEMEFHPNLGNAAYNRRNKMSDSSLRAIESDCRTAILQDKRIVRVNSVVATAISSTTNCSVSFTIVTNDGSTLTSGTALNSVW